MAGNQSGRMKGLLNSSEAASLLLIGEESRDDDNSQDYNEGSCVKVQKRVVVKRFRKEWLNEPIFANWLREIPNNPDKCYCIACKVMLIAGHSELEKHASGKRHSLAIDEMLHKIKPEIESDSEGGVYGNKILIIPNNAVDKKASFPKGTILKRLSPKDKEKLNQPINPQRRLIKRKAVQRTNPQNLPENPDAKIIRMLKSDTEDDYDDEEELEYLEDHLPPSKELLRELKAELKFQEKKMIKDKQKQAEENFSQNGKMDLSHEKELEAGLSLIEEKRRYELNIYKLKLFEMESRVRQAEAEAARAEELHQLRTAHLQLLIQKEQASFIVESPEIENVPQYDVQ